MHHQRKIRPSDQKSLRERVKKVSKCIRIVFVRLIRAKIQTTVIFLSLTALSHHESAKKIAKTTFDVGYSNESGVRELVDNAGTLMGEIELDAERQLMNRFLEELIKTQPKATYGEMMIKKS